jgi:hypothetical protein
LRAPVAEVIEGRADLCSAACRRRAFEERRELEEAAEVVELVVELLRDVRPARLERVARLLRANAAV